MRDEKRLRTVFPDAVCERLAIVGVAAADIADERARMSEIAFGGTRNRSLLGTLNDYAFMAQSVDTRRTEFESPEELMRYLLQTPIFHWTAQARSSDACGVPRQVARTFVSLRCSIVQERFGRVKTSLRRCAVQRATLSGEPGESDRMRIFQI